MLAKRIIPCLDIKDGQTVKGTNFVNLRQAGDPVELGKAYSEQGADELVYLDITASHEGRKTFTDLVKRIAAHINIPFTVGGGINELKDVDRLLNAGAENRMHYAGDISATAPVGKRFTDRQRMIYDIVLHAHTAAVEALRPGVPFLDVHMRACEVMAEDLKSVGLMKGNVHEAVQEGAHALFFPNGLGHMLGLDVHDMEALGEAWVGYDGHPRSTKFGLKSLRLARELEPGYVLTIEPGIYFIPELIDLWRSTGKFKDFLNYDEIEKFRDFGGFRIERDYLILDNGNRRLGKYLPITADEVEAMR